MSPRAHIVLGFVFSLIGVWSSEVSAQPRFGVEASIGQSLGVTSYVKNTVIVQDNRSFIADEAADSGLAIALMFVFNHLEAGLDMRWFDRSRVTVNYAGTTNLPSGRVRPDGTVDDAGIKYEKVDPITLTLPSSNRGLLFAASLFAGYRWHVFDSKSVQLYIPLSGGLVVTHIQEDQLEYEFGLTANTGLGVAIDITSPVALFASGRFHGVLTPSYGRQTDASRSAANTNTSTLSAVADTFVYASVMVGIQFLIR